MLGMFRKRSFFFPLLAGSLTLYAVVAVLYLVVLEVAIVRDVDRADTQRWNASELVKYLLQARQQEGEFLLHEARHLPSSASGTTSAVTANHALLVEAESHAD